MDPSAFSKAKMDNRKLASKSIAQQKRIPNNVRFAFDAIMQLICMNKWCGACHATAAMLYVTLTEEGYSPHIHLGQCKVDRFFDHSWVTLDDKIYDAAIAFDLVDMQYVGPTFAGIDLDTKQETTMLYGNSNLSFDEETRILSVASISDYFDGGKIIWALLHRVFDRVGITYDEGQLRERYSSVHREIEPIKWQVMKGDK